MQILLLLLILFFFLFVFVVLFALDFCRCSVTVTGFEGVPVILGIQLLLLRFAPMQKKVSFRR